MKVNIIDYLIAWHDGQIVYWSLEKAAAPNRAALIQCAINAHKDSVDKLKSLDESEPIESVREEEVWVDAVKLLEWAAHWYEYDSHGGWRKLPYEVTPDPISTKQLLEQFKQQLLK